MAIFGFIVTLLMGTAVMVWTGIMTYFCMLMGSGNDIFYLLIPFCIGCALFVIAWHFCPFMVVMI